MSILLLPGEITVASAPKTNQILYYTETLSIPRHKVTGTLHCTNYHLGFIPDPQAADKVANADGGSCGLAASRCVPLGCITEVNMLHNGRKKSLDGRNTLPKKIVEFEVICKDLRRLVFSVKHCSKNNASSILNALARHTHPSSVHLLFSFDYTRTLKYMKEDIVSGQDSPSFLNPKDWEKELHRLGVTHDQWRVTECNNTFLISESISPYFVCPTNISDSMLEYVASLHQKNRLPVWCWSHPHTGVSLTRGAITEVEDQAEAPDPNFLYAVAMARHIDHQVESKKIQQYNLTKECGTVKDVHSAFSKMQDLCLPSFCRLQYKLGKAGNKAKGIIASTYELSYLDKRWLLSLESSGWLGLVRGCLLSAKEMAHTICVKRKCAMLLENDGRDLSCLISSLVQLMVDPHFRSISGFEALIQKEWVAMGHPFMTRHGLTLDALSYGTEEQLQEGPVFLLFLDCVWHLSRQFPSAFEFSEYYLLHLYDLVHSCLYGNFLFDSPKRRVQASLHSKRSSFFGSGDESMENYDEYDGPLVSAWGRWRASLSKEENEQCLNPFYYIFGSNDAHYDYGTESPIPLVSESLKTVLAGSPERTQGHLGIGNAFGTYRGPSPTTKLKSKDDVRDFYQLGLLLPETSMVNIKVWSGFFFRYIPELMESGRAGFVVQSLESRLVKDVRKLKDELNELELNRGSYVSDLTSFIGEILETREKEIDKDKQLSIVPFRSQLEAMALDYDDDKKDGESERQNGGLPLLTRHKTLPGRMTSLAQFTDALYSSEQQEGGLRPMTMERSMSIPSDPSSISSRSPVTKTRLRVTRTESTDPVQMALRWHPPSASQQRHSPLVANKILSRKDSGVLEGSQDELTEL